MAATTFWLGYKSGGYSILERGPLAIAIWWVIIIGVVLRFWPRAPVPRRAEITLGLLGAFAAWTAASALWAPSSEDALLELNRVTLYLGLAALAVLAVPRGGARRWADGLAIAIVGIAAVALVSRLFPGSFSLRGLPEFLPYSRHRLSFPVDYWNGVGILVGLSVPLLLRTTLVARSALLRGMALAPFPALTAAMYLAASRGGFGTAIVGALAFVVLSGERLRALMALTVAAAGSIASIAVLLARPELVDGPIDSAAAESQGRSGAILLAGLCLGSALSWGVVSGRVPSGLALRPALARGLLAGAAALAVVAIAVADPIERFETFRELPTQLAAPQLAGNSFARAHLLSGNGSGRWQFWGGAIDQFRTAPLQGEGAGTYESWWAQHASFAYFVRDAHSLYLETLGELGIVGFLLLAGALATAAVTGLLRLGQARDSARTTIAALLAAFAGFLFAAAVDWVWELTVVGAVGVVLAGLLCGPGTLPNTAVVEAGGSSSRSDARFGLAVASVVTAWVVLWAQALPLLSEIKVRDSQAAVRRGDTAEAFSDAQAARRLQPWAASPHLQLALVLEQRGDLARARREIQAAIDRDSRDWRLWLVKARLETKDELAEAAARSYARARELNPLSPLFTAP